MENLWIVLTVAAAFLQNLRSVLQKRLTGALSVNGATFVRFCYALPCALAYLAVVAGAQPLPTPGPAFWTWCVTAAVAQILATASLLSAFTLRSFAVSTALSKTEAVQTAVVGLALLGDRLSPLATVGVGVSLVGVLLLMTGVSVRDTVRNPRGIVLGLLAGSFLAVAAVGFRGAALALPEGSVLIRAALTLAVALLLQTAVLGVYLRWREPGELTRVAGVWPRGIWVGLCGAGASAGWFTAMTLQASALVRALGQVELLFAMLASGWLFRERLRPREVAGIVLLVAGIYLVL